MDTAKPSLEIHLGKLPGIDRQALESEFSGFQAMFFEEFGIIIPTMVMREDPDLPDDTFQVVINGQSQPPVKSLKDGEFWLYLPASQLHGQPYFDRIWEVRPAVEPNTGSEASIVLGGDADRQLWIDAGSDTRSRQDYIVFTVASQIRQQPAAFFTPQLLRYYLNRLNDSHPDLISATYELVDTDELSRALKSRLQAAESIQNLPELLEKMLVEKL
jgi:type III secretory pathway component EscV